MQKYYVTITYTDNASISPTAKTLNLYKKAINSSMAITIASSLFGALMNYTGSDGTNLYVITSVTATLIPEE